MAAWWAGEYDVANKERNELKEKIKEISKILESVIKPLRKEYDSMCAEADWYNNNMPGVGITLDYKSHPQKPGGLDLAEIFFKTNK